MNLKIPFSCKSVLLGTSLLIGPALMAQSVQQQSDPQQTPPDNTKTNKRDREQNARTADQQKMNPSDREITKKIRMAIHEDKVLSTYAHNIKIITQDGKVTLKGPVRSEEEKNNVGAKAAAVAGDGNVTNQIDVTPSKQ
ncbi:MAG TPA: BON domain-containing protein [Candidatus Acidoferrum sp.]|nr:BON domain-containing protein [Candidatus Acidoferrum sp.]